MERGCLLLWVALLCSLVSGAPRCGKKRAFQTKYERSSEFQSVEGIASTCNYRIRAPPGLHINLTFDNFQTDPSIFQVRILPKEPSRSVGNVLTMIGPQGSHVAEFSDIAVRIVTSPDATAVTISYEAIIPADGNFGYDILASKKAKLIKSPGFPRIKLPSNIRSIWNIEAKDGLAIVLRIMALSTASDEDYLQVTNGSNVIAKHSGKKTKADLPIIIEASSGSMVISLYTNTGNTKGFKAQVYTTNVTSVVRPDINTSSSGVLQCHQRYREISSGSVRNDNHLTATCSVNQVCGRMVSEGTGVIGGKTLPLVTEIMHCIPRNLCTGYCPPSPRSSTMSVNSCNLTCCSTDMCNSSPDGPALPPDQAKQSNVPDQGLNCHERSEVLRQKGPGEASASGGNSCPAGSTCALYVFSGTSAMFVKKEIVAGYSAKCAVTSECSEAACSRLRETRGVNIESCNVTCCNEDYCNDPDEATIPVVPTPEPSTDYCYDVQQIMQGDTIMLGIMRRAFCNVEEDRCLRVDAALVDNQGRNVMASYGKCVAKSSCESIECSTRMFGFAHAAEVTTCKARCCDTNYCNDFQLFLDPPAVQGTSLWCHSKSETVQEGAIVLGDGPPNTMCNDGYVCALYKFHGTSTEAHQRGEPMAGYSTMCERPSACDEDACRRYATSKDVAAQTCSATCCRTNMCNEPGDTPMPSPRPRPPSGSGIRCFAIQQASMAGTMLMNQKTETSCGSGFSCMRVEAEASSKGGKVSTVMGNCIPAVGCNSLDCNTISGVASGGLPGVKIEWCRAHCCETDLCNDEAIPTTTPPLVTSSSSESDPSASLTMSTSTSTGTSATCYQTLKLKAGNMDLPGSTKEKQSCSTRSQCLKVTAEASHSSFSGLTVNVEYGSCVPFGTCGDFGCDDIPVATPGTKIESCAVACCGGDLCNA